jgi:protein-L-isoaspartate(D-aspartate) O-methyltransferase
MMAETGVTEVVLPSAPDPSIFLKPDDPRRMMADRQLRTFEVFDIGVLSAFEEVLRDRFVAKGYEPVAYADVPVPCASGRRMLLAPMILGRLIQEARILPHETVLDVAGGAGYSACVLGRVAKSVVSLESDGVPAGLDLGANVTRVVGPVTEPPAGQGPFDVILVNGVTEIPLVALLKALTPTGRLMALEPHGAAVRGVRYDRVGEDWTRRVIFNASGPRLPEFAAPATFTF